tara:strand:- start:30314 stop:31804 length:1491 start_codon:yes stop_codon:yes gene_type:complete
MKKYYVIIAMLFLALSAHSTTHTIIANNNNNFVPSTLNIILGDTVDFTNTGGFHNVNGTLATFPNNPQGFGNSVSSSNWTYQYVFNVTGTYNYQCDPHAGMGMFGTITVSSASNTVYDVVAGSTDHTTLKTAIDACSLNGVLSGPGPFTLFAPTDAAFNLLPAGTVTALLNDIPQLTDILKHHVVSDSIMSSTLTNGQIVTTLLGTDVTVTINANGGVLIDNALVTVADQLADNGVVHIIDAVLLPPKDCKGITNGTAMVDTCGTCHQAYIYNFITHQVVFVDNANNLLVGIDYDPSTEIVVLPNDASSPYWNDCPNTVYDIVVGSTDHTTLKTAIDACSLDGVLSGPGPFTLFAPTDAAFNLLPAGTVTALLNDIPQLTDILKHHVVSDSVMSSTLTNGQIVTTLFGTDVTVTINANGVFIDNAQVTVADQLADNGVVHIIDAVLLPNSTTVSEFEIRDIYLYSIDIFGKKVDKDIKDQVIFDIYNNKIIKRLNK